MHWGLLQPKYISSTITMFTQAFCYSEPMTRYVDMQPEEFIPFATLVTEKAARDGLSTVVIDNNKVIACSLVEDITNPLTLPPSLTKKFDPIFTLLDQLSSPYFAGKKFPANHIAHLFITAVHEKYRGLGLSKLVNFGAMELAKSKGFDSMFSELTNILNEKGLIPYLQTEKKLLGAIIYRNFIFNSIKPFAELDGGANSYLWKL